MKVLLWYTREFAYEPTLKTVEEAKEIQHGEAHHDALIAFIHAEETDKEKETSIEKKLAKLLKWAAKKNETRVVVLHSFAHLSESKADPEFTKAFFDRLETRLQNAAYKTAQTPFGYFLDLEMKAPGKPSARIFKSID